MTDDTNLMPIATLLFFAWVFLSDSWDWYKFSPQNSKYRKVGRIGLLLLALAFLLIVKDLIQ